MLKFVHLNIGVRGNRTESIGQLIVMIALGAFCIFTNAYFLAWQTYIMYIDLVLHLGAVAFTIAEMVIASFSIINFKLNSNAASRQ